MKFQFPTNGKAHSDTNQSVLEAWGWKVSIPYEREGTFRPGIERAHIATTEQVSIPYEREGTFRQTLKRILQTKLAASFNSLRTGRHIQTSSFLCLCRFYLFCFNSLRTGRHIQTDTKNYLRSKERR